MEDTEKPLFRHACANGIQYSAAYWIPAFTGTTKAFCFSPCSLCSPWFSLFKLLNLVRPQPAPFAVDQAFDGLKASFVSHLAAVANPIAQIEISQPERFALLDLPVDVVSPQACAFVVRIEEG